MPGGSTIERGTAINKWLTSYNAAASIASPWAVTCSIVVPFRHRFIRAVFGAAGASVVSGLGVFVGRNATGTLIGVTPLQVTEIVAVPNGTTLAIGLNLRPLIAKQGIAEGSGGPISDGQRFDVYFLMYNGGAGDFIIQPTLAIEVEHIPRAAL